MLNKNILITPIGKSEANSQSKPHVPRSQPIGNLASELSLLKIKIGIGRSSDPVDNPMSYPVHNRIHGLVPINYEFNSYQC